MPLVRVIRRPVESLLKSMVTAQTYVYIEHCYCEDIHLLRFLSI